MKVPRRIIRPAVEQAMAYLAKCPPAIQGQDGNGTTARLAKAVVLGFDLDPQLALSAFRPWNETCQPPWPEKDLLRLLDFAAARNLKVVDAMIAKAEYNRSRSYKHGGKLA